MGHGSKKTGDKSFLGTVFLLLIDCFGYPIVFRLTCGNFPGFQIPPLEAWGGLFTRRGGGLFRRGGDCLEGGGGC